MKYKWMKMILLIVCVGVISLFTVAESEAHSNLTEAIPGEEEVVEESPERIHLQFSAGIENEYSFIFLLRENEEAINLERQDEARDEMVADIPELEEGIYYVYWRVLSEDTHIVDGAYRFAVATELPPGAEDEFLTFEEARTLVEQQEQAAEELVEEDVREEDDDLIGADDEAVDEEGVDEEDVEENGAEQEPTDEVAENEATNWLVLVAIIAAIVIGLIVYFARRKA